MIPFLILSGVIALIVFRFKLELEEGYKYVGRASAPIRSKLLPVPPYYKELLEKYYRYYQGLSEPNKRHFEQRVCRFIYAKRFFPRGMREVPMEMAVFIAAAAVQITFGLPNIYLEHFDKILVYPDNYYSNITRRFHKGEVNPAFGIIVLSWQNLMEGFLHAENGTNLGLHEMAHALRLENVIRNEEVGFFDKKELGELDAWADRICLSTQTIQATLFRPYACTNNQEFFSVAVENFFERPSRFHEELPELYAILVSLLKQDPLTITASAPAA